MHEMRQIRPTEESALLELFMSQPKFMARMPAEELNNLFTKKQVTRYGLFSEGVLDCTVSATSFEFMPGILLSTMVQRPSSTGLLFDSTKMRELLQFVLTEGEKQGVYNFYSVRRVEEFRIQSRRSLWDGWTSERYTGYTECFIPKNTLPKYSLYAKFMGDRPLPYDSLVRSQRLRDQFRFQDNPMYIDPVNYQG